jgi:hypothetical protein
MAPRISSPELPLSFQTFARLGKPLDRSGLTEADSGTFSRHQHLMFASWIEPAYRLKIPAAIS